MKLSKLDRDKVESFVSEWFKKFEKVFCKNGQNFSFSNFYNDAFKGECTYSFSSDECSIGKIIITIKFVIDFFEFDLEIRDISLNYDKTFFTNLDCEVDIFQEVNEFFSKFEIVVDNMLGKTFPNKTEDFYNTVVEEIQDSFTKKFRDKFNIQGV